MICFLIPVILMISSYFLMISFIYSVLTNIIIDFHGNHVIINLTNSNLIRSCMQALFFDVMGFSN